MKTQLFTGLLMPMAGMALLVSSVLDAPAQNSPNAAATATAVETASAHEFAAIQLSNGAPDILKLARAKIGEEAILAFIQNSHRDYNLSVPEIIYLRREGVSDRVLATMLSQRQEVVENTAQTAPPAPTAAAAPQEAQSVAPSPQPAPPYVQPAVTYVQSAPVYVPSSTVYVAPPTYVDYGYYPYYYPYYGYSYPAFSFSVGLGGPGYWGGYRAGGGNFHTGGGGFHGGGGSRGGGGPHR